MKNELMRRSTVPLHNHKPCCLSLLFAALIWLAGGVNVRAHDPGLSTATLQLDTNKLEAVLVFSVVDTAQIVDLDKNHDGQISKEELAAATAKLQQIAAQSLEVKFDGQP